MRVKRGTEMGNVKSSLVRTMWAEMLCGERVACFISTEEQAERRIIRDRRLDGRLYSLERIASEPIPYL